MSYKAVTTLRLLRTRKTMYPDGGEKDNQKPDRSERNLSGEYGDDRRDAPFPKAKSKARSKAKFELIFARAASAVLGAIFCLSFDVAVASQGEAAEQLRLGVQKTGTFAWELDVIKKSGLDAKAGLDLVVTELASTEAGKVAMMGGSVDIILSDWLWVARERGLGSNLTFAPYSTALGAVMIPAASPVKSLADLHGRSIGVAGGPIDKSWLLLRAFAQRDGLDLKGSANVVFGAPALLYQKAASGELDANLTFWNYAVALEARGFRRLIGMDAVEEALGAKGPLAMVGYVFDENLAKTHGDALARFLKISRVAKDELAHSDADWEQIGKELGIADPKELALYRKSYTEGIPTRPVEAEAADAAALYRVMRDIGGPELVGAASELNPGTFYRGADPSPADH
jgi:NitT/TauT family transport system substrate-binding protein